MGATTVDLRGSWWLLVAVPCLLSGVASARHALVVPGADDRPQGNHLLTGDNGNPSESPLTKFYGSCMEISRKAKEAFDDESLIGEIDDLAASVCHLPPPDLEKLRSDAACSACHNLLDWIDEVVGDTKQQLLILVYLLRACEFQPLFEQCDKVVFAVTPAVLTGMKTMAGMDTCHMVHICEAPRNQTSYAKPTEHRRI